MSKREQAKLQEVFEQLHQHGLECGREIARLAEEMHPDALAVVPLYRSCVVVLQDEQMKQAGNCKLILYGDPHWLGYKTITKKLLRRKAFHDTVIVKGERSNPRLFVRWGNRYHELKVSTRWTRTLGSP